MNHSNKILTISVEPEPRYMTSMYIDSDTLSLFSNDGDGDNYVYSDESEYEWHHSNNEQHRVSEIFNKSRYSLYTDPRYSSDLNREYNNNETDNEIDPIIDMYMYDDSHIEPMMSLPLTQNQYMLMKERWNKQLEMELRKDNVKQQKIMSWSGFSDSYNTSEDYPTALRNSNLSNISEKSKKSVKSASSWKSFISKFSKKQKKEIKFYDNLLQKK
jgi:hypothetical protein